MRPDDRIAITPARIDLEPLSCGAGTTIPLAIRNPRDESIDLAISSTLPNVSVVPAHATLAPGDSIEVAVALTAPATPVAATGALVITSGAENLAVPITMSATGVSIVVDPPLLDFGEALPGDAIERKVTVAATGTTAARVTVSAPSSAEYEVLDPTTTISPGGSRQFTIRFTAGSTPQKHPATVALGVDGPLCGALPVLGLIGGTSDNLVVSDHTVVDFGAVRCPPTFDLIQLELTNRGQVGTDFAVRAADPGSLFFAADGAGLPARGTLASNESATVFIVRRSFRDIAPGLSVGLVAIELNAGTVVKLIPVRALLQRAIVKPEHPVLDFGDVPAGTSVTRSFQIVNSGNVAGGMDIFSADSELAISPLQVQVPAHNGQPIEVMFTASAPAGTMFDGFITMFSDSCEPTEVVAVRARVVQN